ncbi:MAG: hypothetical protein QM490_03580 [Candidatus Gracilibacteria bacterium]
MAYFKKYDYTIIRKHWIILLFRYLKVGVFLLFTFLVYHFTITQKHLIGDEIINIFIFPAIFLGVNYAFIKLILGYIKFYNDLLVIYGGQLIVIKTSLFFKNDIEFIDINKITKLDTYCRGLVANILSYGVLVVEQQRDQVREFSYISEPFIALQILNEEKLRTIEDRKKTYVVSKSKMRK